MFAIRARRKVATERDFLDAVEKVVRQGTKFSSTYVTHAKRATDRLTNVKWVRQALVSSVQLDFLIPYCNLVRPMHPP